jgi:Carboxypeptidase regulatory-like domain/TonB dependent receptor-like, beta-barrel
MKKLARSMTTQDRRLESRSMAKIFSVFAVLLLLFSGSKAGMSQGITGSITGSVTDPSGAVIPGATVTVRNVVTNAVRTVNSSDAGTFTVTQLPPGPYSLKVDKSGFKSYQQSGITLAIDQAAKIDVRLTVGSAEQNVEVTSMGPVIQTEDSSVGQVIDSQAIQNTPLNGRLSVMGLIALSPGVQGVGAQDQLAVRGMTFAVGTGSRNAYGGLGSTLDGVVNAEVTLQRAEPEVPSIDALSEFKVLTTGAPAEFNQPAQVIVVTASGTNQFHGELLEYNRSKGTSAKPYFGAGKPRPAYERNEFGGNFSGPITFPGYNGKDRSFFFVSFEGFHLSQSASVNSQQPTLKMRSGDFSEFLDANGDGNCTQTNSSGVNPGYYCIYDPTTGQKFPGNIIPNFTARLNSVSSQLLNLLYPKPTTSGTGTNTFELVPYTSNAKRFSLRIDHKISDKDQIRGTFLEALYGPNPDVGSSSLQGGFSGDGEHNTNTILGWTHTFSPTLLMDTDASYFHLPIYRTPQNYTTKWESIIPGLSPQLIEGAPQISITNITGVGEQGSKDLEQVIQANTSITKVFPRHTIKAGFGYLYDNHWNDSAVSPQRGSYSFNGQYTSDAGAAPANEKSGIAFADFLLGIPATTGQGTPGNFITRNISSQWAAYIQDDWKPLPKLTINLGIRYDLQWFEPGPYGEFSLYVPSLNKVVVFGSSYPSGAIGSYVSSLTASGLMTLSSTANISSNPFSFLGRPDKDFAPRFGFAYQVMPDTVLRGAFGIYFNLLPASYMGNMFGTLPFEASQSFTNSKTYASAFTMSNPFSATGTYSANPSVNAQHALVTPYTEEYNLALEHQFPRAVDIRIGYVGQHNVKQNNYGGNGNYAPNLNLADPAIVGSTVQSTNLHQPFASIPYNIDPLFHSTMNSLQVGVHKQYTQGLAFGAEYQWTRVLGTESLEDPSGKYPNDSFGNVGGITPQVLQVNYSYALPMGKGKMLFSSAGDVANKIIGGWQLSGITDIQSGQPFSVSYSAPGSPVGQVGGRANRVPGVSLYPSSKTKSQWFNPAAFTAPPCYNSVMTGDATHNCQAVYQAGQTAGVTTYATYGTSGYNMLRGPRYQDWDMSLQKNTTFHERYNVQLRADSFNVFNHPNFNTPNANISNSNVGTITSTSGTPSYEQRTLEFAVKLNF